MGLQEILALQAKRTGYKPEENTHVPVKPSGPKPKQPIAFRSKKQQGTVNLLSKLYPIYLKKRPFCKIKSPVCTKIATCVNHTAGRGEDVVLDQQTWEPSCEHCNGYIEQHDAWAREHGHKISRITSIHKNQNIMTQEEILQLSCLKHIKIWKLKQLGLDNKEISKLIGSNTGHIYNVLKEYRDNPAKVEAAEKV